MLSVICPSNREDANTLYHVGTDYLLGTYTSEF
jgi:hypothetical protein